MQIHAGWNLHQQDMIVIPILVLARDVGTSDLDRRVAEVKRRTQQFVQLLCILVNTLYFPGLV